MWIKKIQKNFCRFKIYLYLHHNLIQNPHTQYMDNKIKRDVSLINLVSEFENDFDNGNVGYLDEKSFYQILDFYEDEYCFDRALEVVDIAINQYKYRSEFYITKARLQLNTQKVSDCLKTLEIVETIAPYEREISIIKIRALAILKKFKEAFQIIDNVQDFSTKSENAELLVGESYIYEYMKDYARMYETLAKAVELDCKNEEALERIWMSVELSRNYKSSVSLHKEIVEKDPYNYQAWFNLGHGYSCLNKYELAIDALEYSFLANPNFESAYLDCAELCFQIGQYEKALDIFMDAQKRFEANQELYVNIANCLMAIKDIPQAKQWLIKSIKYDGYNDEAYYLLGECYSLEGTWYNAINAYHKAIELDDRREEYYLGLAKAYVQVEDFNKATINFQLATETGPEESLAWCQYVLFLLKLNLIDEAFMVLDESMDYTAGADLDCCRAIAHFKIGEEQEFYDLLDEVLQDDFSLQKMLFEMLPELRLNSQVTAMIKYYEEI